MSRPALKLKRPQRPDNAADCPKCDGWIQYRINTDDHGCVKCDYVANGEQAASDEPKPLYPHPKEWIKGQLLNVRRSGDNFMLTVLGEEFDPRHLERALVFDNAYDCQQFVSWWYQREPGRMG